MYNANPTLAELYAISPAPWGRSAWHGSFVSLDDTATDDFAIEDVTAVVAFGTTDDDWDGLNAGIAKLKDGRFVGWECGWGPTGNGFSEDAYGGDADILFARTAYTIEHHLSQQARELLKRG